MSFLLKVRCHLLDGNLCVLAGLLLSVPLLRAGLFQCDCSPSQALSFPGAMLLPCISPNACQMSARVSTREGTRPRGCKWVGKGGVLILAQRDQLFVLAAPFLPRLELSKPPLDIVMPLSPFLCLGSPTTFHELQKCKNPSDFWSEPFVVLKGKIMQGSSIQEDFGVSLLLISVTARPGVGLNTQIHH